MKPKGFTLKSLHQADETIVLLQAENAALKDRAAQLVSERDNLQALWTVAHNERSEAMLELAALKSRSAAPEDALLSIARS